MSPGAASGLSFLAFVLSLYLLPSIVAVSRHVPGAAGLVVANVLFGWTVIGWISAMVAALGPVAAVVAEPDGPIVVNQLIVVDATGEWCEQFFLDGPHG